MSVRRSSWLAALGAVAAAAALGYGLFALMELRYRMGDVYPAYSSLATDPTGTKALHDTLAEFDDLTVTRNLAPLAALATGPGDVVMMMGFKASDVGSRTGGPVFSDTEWGLLKRMSASGARVVVALQVETNMTSPAAVTAAGYTTTSMAGLSDSGLRWLEAPSEVPYYSPRTWTRSIAEPVSDDMPGTFTQVGQASFRVASEVGAGSPVGPARASDQWIATARKSKRAGLEVQGAISVERTLGRGSVAVVAEPYPFTNEALRLRDSMAAIAWAIGPAPVRVIFDETHLGLSEQPGIATLARRFGLAGLAPGLAVALGLWLWRVRSSLAPPASGTTDTGGVAVAGTGKDAATGLTNLLRRRVAPDALFDACVAEWERTLAPAADATILARRDEARRAMRMELDSHPRERDAVAAYARVTAILNRRD